MQIGRHFYWIKIGILFSTSTYKMRSLPPTPAAYEGASRLWLSWWRCWPVRVGVLA